MRRRDSRLRSVTRGSGDGAGAWCAEPVGPQNGPCAAAPVWSCVAGFLHWSQQPLFASGRLERSDADGADELGWWPKRRRGRTWVNADVRAERALACEEGLCELAEPLGPRRRRTSSPRIPTGWPSGQAGGGLRRQRPGLDRRRRSVRRSRRPPADLALEFALAGKVLGKVVGNLLLDSLDQVQSLGFGDPHGLGEVLGGGHRPRSGRGRTRRASYDVAGHHSVRRGVERAVRHLADARGPVRDSSRTDGAGRGRRDLRRGVVVDAAVVAPVDRCPNLDGQGSGGRTINTLAVVAGVLGCGEALIVIRELWPSPAAPGRSARRHPAHTVVLEPPSTAGGGREDLGRWLAEHLARPAGMLAVLRGDLALLERFMLDRHALFLTGLVVPPAFFGLVALTGGISGTRSPPTCNRGRGIGSTPPDL
ncbi:hypothetical protein DFJ69_3371 [Thermomonospora umbrina]|uniref:Uncharacterized protein n=1 Tax=Thermomonospora umbrina TaxID=111806 RepID=A0A3D9SZ97_9ACTN|nr:hypothetical protein DFJ69_3371 [Thermomonospora umbrina]